MNLDSDPEPDRDNSRMIRNRYLEQCERRFVNTVEDQSSCRAWKQKSEAIEKALTVTALASECVLPTFNVVGEYH